MTEICQICGKAFPVPVWSEDYERLKQSQSPVFICPACQARISREAAEEKRRA